MKTSALILSALLALALAPAVAAQPAIPYPTPEQMDHIAALAHDIDATATEIHHDFERNNRRPNEREARAMMGLHELNERARRFHDNVLSYHQDPQRTADAFQAMLDSFYVAAERMRDLPRRPYVDSGMYRIEDMMGELSQYYGRYSDYEGRGYHRRHERDRDEEHHYIPPPPPPGLN